MMVLDKNSLYKEPLLSIHLLATKTYLEFVTITYHVIIVDKTNLLGIKIRILCCCGTKGVKMVISCGFLRLSHLQYLPLHNT